MFTGHSQFYNSKGDFLDILNGYSVLRQIISDTRAASSHVTHRTVNLGRQLTFKISVLIYNTELRIIQGSLSRAVKSPLDRSRSGWSHALHPACRPHAKRT